MSRSNDEKLVNPSNKFLKWKGGKFEWYNKETKENIEVKLPVKFLVLDILSTIKGYSDIDQSGFWSNEVRDTTKEIMTVFTGKGKKTSGLYKEVKADPKCTGAKYSQSVYVALLEGKTLSLCNIQMMGAALSSWIEFAKDNDVYKGSVEVKSSLEAKKGATVYQIPVFTKGDSTDKMDKEAIELDKILQDYLTLYFNKNSAPAITEEEIDQTK